MFCGLVVMMLIVTLFVLFKAQRTINILTNFISAAAEIPADEVLSAIQEERAILPMTSEEPKEEGYAAPEAVAIKFLENYVTVDSSDSMEEKRERIKDYVTPQLLSELFPEVEEYVPTETYSIEPRKISAYTRIIGDQKAEVLTTYITSSFVNGNRYEVNSIMVLGMELGSSGWVTTEIVRKANLTISVLDEWEL